MRIVVCKQRPIMGATSSATYAVTLADVRNDAPIMAASFAWAKYVTVTKPEGLESERAPNAAPAVH
jgi:hypothetical protein